MQIFTNLLIWLSQQDWSRLFKRTPTPLQTPQNSPVEPVKPDPTPTPPAPPTPSPAPAQDRIQTACYGIQEFEGFIPPGGRDSSGKVYPTGSPAYRNNNPGNCRWPYGAPYPVGSTGVDSGAFLVFDSYKHGFEYLKNTVSAVARGVAAQDGAYQKRARELHLPDCSHLTILQYFEVRDPSSDNNNPAAFARYVGARLQLDEKTAPMSALLA